MGPFKMIRWDVNDPMDIVKITLTVIVYAFMCAFLYEELSQMVDPNITDRLYGNPGDYNDENKVVISPWRRPILYFGKFGDFWEVVHVANICTLLVMLSTLITWFTTPLVEKYSVEAHTTYQNLYPAAKFQHRDRAFEGLNVFVALFKTFKFLRLNLRLNMMWLTLGKASDFLAGFLMVFIVCLLGFVMLGTLVFGNNSRNYYSADASVSSIFRLILSDFDYKHLKQISPQVAPVFFYSYSIILFFVMLNMFIAIINDAFKDVSKALLDVNEETSGMTWLEMLTCRPVQQMMDSVNDATVMNYMKKKEEEEREKEKAKAEKEKEKAS